MFIPIPGRKPALAYLVWRFLLYHRGSFQARLDEFFFGHGEGINQYSTLVSSYKKSDVKPDKQYSILPTILMLLGDCRKKIVADLGCGSGFFTVPIAEQGSCVYGLDNCPTQIALANEAGQHDGVQYYLRNIFTDKLPDVDIMVVPFVANYARSVPILCHLLRQIYAHLALGGRLILVVDLPNGRNHMRFGARKTVSGKMKDETLITIELFNGTTPLCTLESVYFTPTTIEHILGKIGFNAIQWHRPIVSEEGIRTMKPGFWDGYQDNPELGYLTAVK